ncbi:hypothetical protein Vafri_4028 [Volvox africanus]|uniref:F-box domain-containing protein n=1 Tax=Volvox africanus TaxID=51714 RepID=A0A8J4EUF8_9CHLO|nr:hypothetical protein Vafri_4028 [Volvox africanus]
MRTSYLVLAWWTHREHNTRAMRELQMLFERAFRKDADKGVQLAMFEDLQTALHQAERMGRLDRTLDQLIAAAVRVLPKQKRTLVVTAQKRAAVQMRRSARRGDGMEGNSETGPDDDGTHNLAALDDLPVEVVEAIFGHLGPVELARCTCVSRSWRDSSRGADIVWHALYGLTFPDTASTAQHNLPTTNASAYRAFQQAAAGRPRGLKRWSGRVLGLSGPAWLSSSALRFMAPSRVAALKFPRVDQVVRWACGQPTGRFSNSSSVESSSGESDNAAAGTASRMRLWALANK